DGRVLNLDHATLVMQHTNGAASFVFRSDSNHLNGDVAAAQKVYVLGDRFNNTTLTADQGFTNAGTLTLLNLTNDGGHRNAIVNPSSGPPNSTGSLIVCRRTAAGARQINGSFANQAGGTVNRGEPTSDTTGGGSITNSGQFTIAATGGLTLNAGGQSF